MNISFYRYIDNWHKHPWLAGLLCKLGRHDYEFAGQVNRERINPRYVYINARLYCIYCEQVKYSGTTVVDFEIPPSSSNG